MTCRHAEQVGVHSILRDRILARAGLVELPPSPFASATFDSLRQSEWSDEFEKLMRNRLIMGALRYAPMSEKKKRKRRWDLLGAIRAKIEKYEETGNTEYLVDMANYCLLEFECGHHPKRHFHALDDHHDHCREIPSQGAIERLEQSTPDAVRPGK